jgi:hypothetical protein
MSQERGERGGITVRAMAATLGIRLGTAYGLLWDESVTGRKDENGEWVIAPESVEAYRLRRTIRRPASRSALRRSAIDMVVEAGTTT